MKRAIKTLQVRIETLYGRIAEAEYTVDNPEMMSDYHFAMNDLENLRSEVEELQEAIRILIPKLK